MARVRPRSPHPSSRHATPAPPPALSHLSLTESWTQQPASVRVLRAFLGVTFVYAGIQKMADKHFLSGGGSTYIGSQLRRFAEGSPIGGLLRLSAHFPTVVGVGVAFLEIAVGLATLLGIAQKAAAATGFSLNAMLFLSASWHVHPYFLGSDSIYAVAWVTYGASVMEAERRRARKAKLRSPKAAPGELTRRQFMRGGAVAVLSLALVGMARSFSLANSVTGPARPDIASGSELPGQPTALSAGHPIIALDRLPIGQAVGFKAPSGDPAVLVRLRGRDVVAFSRVCTHAGCLVGYDPSARLLVCPCHGAEFDPAHRASVVAGPAPLPLPSIDVAVDAASGQVVVTG